MCLNYPAARFLHGGGSNIITIRREPHCSHFRRLSSEDGGKSGAALSPQGFEATSYQLAPVS